MFIRLYSQLIILLIRDSGIGALRATDPETMTWP